MWQLSAQLNGGSKHTFHIHSFALCLRGAAVYTPAVCKMARFQLLNRWTGRRLAVKRDGQRQTLLQDNPKKSRAAALPMQLVAQSRYKKKRGLVRIWSVLPTQAHSDLPLALLRSAARSTIKSVWTGLADQGRPGSLVLMLWPKITIHRRIIFCSNVPMMWFVCLVLVCVQVSTYRMFVSSAKQPRSHF